MTQRKWKEGVLEAVQRKIAEKWAKDLPDYMQADVWYPHTTLLQDMQADLGKIAQHLEENFEPFCGEVQTIEFSRVEKVGYVDDFSNYMADMEDEISVSFQITRFAYGRGNYQRMEIYGSEGAIVYSLDATPAGIDEIEVCSGDINADAHVFNHLPIPQQYFCDQMQSFADIVNGTGDGLAANIQDGQANQHLLDAIVESAEKGTWLSL